MSVRANQSSKTPTSHRTMLNMSHGQHEVTAGPGHTAISPKDKGTQGTGVSRTQMAAITVQGTMASNSRKTKKVQA